MAYSGGMPILYPVAFFNFFFLYWIYKFLLIKHYRKTSSFDQDLAFSSIFFFKIAFVLHIVWTVFMFTESHLLTLNISTIINDFNKDVGREYDKLEKKL